MVKSGDLALLVGGGRRVSGRRREDYYWEGAQKNNCRWEGSEWRTRGLYYWEEHKKKLSAGGRGVSGRKNEDFITGKEQKKIQVPVGRGVSGRSEDFITGRKHKKKLSAGGRGGEWKEEWRLYYWKGAENVFQVPVGGGWVEGVKTLLPGGTTKKFTAGARGVGVWEKVWRFWHRHVAPQQKYNIKGREGNTENKIKTSKQSKHKMLSSRHKVKFVSHPLPATKISVTTPSKGQASEVRKLRKNEKFQSARPLYP